MFKNNIFTITKALIIFLKNLIFFLNISKKIFQKKIFKLNIINLKNKINIIIKQIKKYECTKFNRELPIIVFIIKKHFFNFIIKFIWRNKRTPTFFFKNKYLKKSKIKYQYYKFKKFNM